MTKLTADDIFDGQRFLGPDRVLILEDDGTVSAIVPRSWAGEDVRKIDGWLCPGFINTHCHLELSHMKGVVPEGTGLPAFLTTVMERRQPATPDILEEAILDAAEEMRQEGIVAVGDICNTTATLSAKQQSPIYWHSFIECMGFIDKVAHQRLEQSLTVYGRFAADGLPCSLVPHAPYSVSSTLFQLLGSIENNTPLTIHNQECADEDALFQNGNGAFLEFYRHFGMDISGFSPSGKSSLQTYLPYFPHADKLLLVHNTYTTMADIHFAQEGAASIYWCLCPNANAYIEKRLPDIPTFLRAEGRITLGTDSLASNHRLSLWSEISTIRKYYPEIPLAALLQWATYNGAEALGISGVYGSFEKGKRPGIVQIQDDHAKACTI